MLIMKKHISTLILRLGGVMSIGLCSSLMLVNAHASGEDLLKAADPEVNKQYVRERFGKIQNKKFDATDTKKKLLLIGDSQAQDFLNSAMEHDHLKDYQIRTRHIPAQCQPFLGEPSESGVKSKDEALCADVDSLEKAKDQIANADVIVLASLWKDWAVKQLPQTIENLALTDTQKLIVIGRKSFGRISLRHYLRMSESKRISLRNPINKVFFKDNDTLREHLNDETFVDQYTIICGTGKDSCPVFTPEGALISFDGGHLTKAGARFVGELIFKSKALSNLKPKEES